MFGGIRTRLLGLVVATVVPFLALTGGGLWSQWRDDQAQALRSALNEARLVADQVDDELGNFESLLAGLSRAVSPNPADIAKNDAVLRRAKADVPSYISNILVTTLDGNNIGTSFEIAEEGRSYLGDRDFFLQVLHGKRLAMGEPIRGRTTGKWISSLARRVEDPYGRLVAVMTVGIQLERFQDGLRLPTLPAGSVVQIVNENGIVLSRSVDGANWVSRNLVTDAHVARHMAMEQASEAVRWADGVERITGSTTVHRVPWLVSVGLPMDIALARVESRLIWGAMAGTAALLIALALAWAFSSRIVRPLRQLNEDATALAAGELSHRTAFSSRDEVGALAASFNAMAASLEGRHRELTVAREAAASEADKRARLEQMERQAKETLAAVIDASPVAIVCSDLERRIVVWSRAAQQIFGYSAEEAIGHRTKLVPPEGVAESQALFERCIKGETIRDIEVKRCRKDGSLVDIELAATPMYHPDGAVWGVAWAYDDISDRKEADQQLRHLAHFDQLTGLSNRVALQSELTRLIQDGTGSVAIAMFDLDGFKDVNDTDGHSTGDQLLINVARRLTNVVGDRGRVCRLGGDEFVVIIPECGDPREAAELVDRMLKELAQPFEFDEHVLQIGGSAGIAFAPRDGSTADELIANADLALYKAKSEGGHTYRVFVPVLRAQAQSRRGLQFELRRAFVENEFELHYQPLVRLADEAVVGAEALLRWRHPMRGIVSPGAFIDSLANSAIASDVGRWILQEACDKVAAWRAQGLVLGRMSVNLFPSQSRDPGLSDDVDALLKRAGLPTEVLELEISETVALNHDDAIVPLQRLHDKGIKLAFDDFGTGYASLSYLTRFPVSRIKIDRSFVAKIIDSAQDAAIVRSLIAMAHNLGLGIIAEGVETIEQARFLMAEHCEEAQGFLYAKPLAPADFEAYLRSHQLAREGSGAADNQFYRAGQAQRGGVRPSNRRRPRA